MSAVPPVRKELVVAASAAHAFEVFTSGIDRWWPRQHHIGSSPLKHQVLEPGVGGRWYGVCEDGSECDVGKVLVWDPPHRLLLTWQIDGSWKFDPGFTTEIEVTFTAEGPKTTRLVLEHRDLHRYGLAAPTFRRAIDSEEGWGLILQRFGDECSR